MKSHEYRTKPSRYRSYVVRCWQEYSVHARQKLLVWRFSLEDTQTSQRRGFATLEDLLVSMQAELADDRIEKDDFGPEEP